MDHLEKVEELVAKAGCSYADAKEALEKTDWNMLDAIIVLEQAGKAEKTSASFSTDSSAEPEAFVTSQAVQTTYSDNSEAEQEGTERFEQKPRAEKGRFRDACKHFFVTAKQVLTMNFVTIFSRNGNQLVHIPIWVALIPLLIWFWGVVILCLALMVLGCRFHFEGRDFGKTGINETIDRASKAAYDAGQKVKQEFSGKPEDSSDSGTRE